MAKNDTQDQTDQAKAEAEANQRAADAAAANKAREEAKALDAASAPYVVAPGGSISCRMGVVDAGQPLTASMFERGQKDLDDFVSRGVVLRRF